MNSKAFICLIFRKIAFNKKKIFKKLTISIAKVRYSPHTCLWKFGDSVQAMQVPRDTGGLLRGPQVRN